jgi:hypothetical protein
VQFVESEDQKRAADASVSRTAAKLTRNYTGSTATANSVKSDLISPEETKRLLAQFANCYFLNMKSSLKKKIQLLSWIFGSKTSLKKPVGCLFNICLNANSLCFPSELLKTYNKGVKKLNKTDMDELKSMDFDNNEDLDDQLEEFQRRIRPNPDQCLRYCRGYFSPILWMGSQNQCTEKDLPRCKHCEGKLVFEFQVLPQALYFLSVDGWEGARHCSMDWGTLAVFTCESSCGDGNKQYFTEYVHCQRSPGALQEFK